jgi:hypothetical protein
MLRANRCLPISDQVDACRGLPAVSLSRAGRKLGKVAPDPCEATDRWFTVSDEGYW